MKLRISNDLVLGADFVTSTQAILAKRRVGKSYVAQVQAEELLEAKQQIVAMDPTDAWWGLRSSADGKKPGYPITIFGGRHGDVPLDAMSGAALASAIVTEGFSAVISLKLFSKTERMRFAADFLETLYRENRRAMHLFIDEADTFVPQTPRSKEQSRCMEATDELVRRGGIDGVGVTLISQRAAVLNKDVLSQIDRLIALRIIARPDIEQVTRWMSVHGTTEQVRELETSLPSLEQGSAWIWTPENARFHRITIRTKHTYDSGRTPKAGERRVDPKQLAKVDLERLGRKLAEAVDRAKANDPTALKAEVARLKKANAELTAGIEREVRRQLAWIAKQPKQKSETPPKVVDKRVVAAKDLKRLENVVERMNVQIDGLGETRSKLISTRDDIVGVSAFWAGITQKQIASQPRVADEARSAPLLKPIVKHRDRVPLPSSVATKAAPQEHGLAPAHLRILSSIAWWESVGIAQPDLGGVAFAAKTSTKSSAFHNNRSRLRAGGFIDYPSAGRVCLTHAGREIAPPPTMPPTNEAIQDAILAEVTPAHGRMLRALIDEHPNEMSLEEFAKRSETSTTSSAFHNNRSWLKARGLAEYPRPGFVRAASVLFPEGQ